MRVTLSVLFQVQCGLQPEVVLLPHPSGFSRRWTQKQVFLACRKDYTVVQLESGELRFLGNMVHGQPRSSPMDDEMMMIVMMGGW